jgi:hypothetical protein
MSEIFTIVCENVSVTAAQDVLCAYAAATKKLQVLGVELAANGQTTVGNYPLRLRYLPATVTPGSGGSAVTPHNINPDGAAASFTARRNDTSQATSSGTIVDIVPTQFNPINGYYWTPPPAVQQGDEPKIELSGAFSLSLDGVSGTLGVSATVWLREV